MPKIERTFEQLWLVMDNGDRFNVAELLATVVRSGKKVKKEESLPDEDH